MIKLIVFDLDGVLVDARELHYEALNMALRDIEDCYVISRAEHLSTYDGLSTTKKLQMLSDKKGLPEEFHNSIWKAKQQKTIEIIDSFDYDHRIIKVLKRLKLDGYTVACATNSIRDTAKLQLIRRGFF